MSSPPRPPASAARSRGSGAGRSPGWRLGSNRHQPDVGRGQIAERQDAGTKPGTNEDALVPIADIAAGETVAIARDIADRADEREANLPAMGMAGQEDRKSVGEGKSVSVRVDLGGRRIIKKKKNN